MSVLRQGGTFLQRRLTKLYTDTKSSCENVSTAARPNEDPELVALNVNFRTQKDRLLAWGLDWSDANAAQPNDIDEALGEAGVSDVVAGVMSSIQQVLNEAERLQQPNTARQADSLTKGTMPGGFPAAGQPAAVKTSWTGEEINRLKELLDHLSSLIDTLYELSLSRRNMSMNIAPNTQSTTHGEFRKPLPKTSVDSKMRESQNYNAVGSTSKKKVPPKERHSTYPPLEQIEMAPFLNLRAESNNLPAPAVDPFAPTKRFRIDKAALQLSEPGARQASNPPPYEAVAASANSRAVGRLKTAALPAPLTTSMNEPTVPVLVEFSPISLERQNSLVLPSEERLRGLCETLDRLLEHTRVAHLGLLKFVGYLVDITYSRYGFIYQLPVVFFPLLNQPSENITPKPLASLFYSGHDREEASIPNLEDRFRLAYDIVLAVLHLRSQNVVHGNLNSNNILIFPGYQFSRGEISSSSDADLRHLYLASMTQFDGGDKNAPSESLSSRIYRHPDDAQRISDPCAWAYDMYSVGLILLEIGLWTPLSRLWKMKYNLSTFKSRIENVYISKLGSKCGSGFLQAVQLCLDAPNFHLSSEPMSDLRLRFSQASHYPWLEPGDCNNWCAFSKNFVYSIGSILFRCASLDLFSGPPCEDLKENLPPPLDVEQHGSHVQNTQPQLEAIEDPHFGRQFDEPVLHWEPEHDMPPMPSSKKHLREEVDGNPEKRSRKRTLKRWSNEEIPEYHLQEWNQFIMPKISRLLQKVLKDSSESCGVSLMVAGETPQTAKTTICVTCTSVRKVRAALKKYFDYDRENWDVIVMKGGIKRSKVPRARKKKQQRSTPGGNGGPSRPDPNPYYQKRPLCGASIGAFIQDEHLPPVSYGGVILVDGVPYGMTVHHMLDAPYDEDDDEDDGFDQPPRSAAHFRGNLPMPAEPDFAYSWCDDELAEPSYTLEISDDEDGDDISLAGSDDGAYDDYWISDGYSSDDGDDGDDAASIGDTAGILPGEEQGIVVTQPAIDDVNDEFFPRLEDRDDEHLASHQLGHIHASSGIRRWTRDGIKHEVDWALISVDEDRMEPSNTIPGSSDRTVDNGAMESGQKLSTNLNKVARLDELGGLQVQCCGRTSGLQTGRIARAMALVKLHGRQSFSTSFSVDGNFGVPGDSGAWVFDDAGHVCGHVLAWSERSRTAYIAPMRILLDDIARTLGTDNVSLPASKDQTADTCTTPLASGRGPRQGPRPSAPQPQSVDRDSMSFELSKLSLEQPNPPPRGELPARKHMPDASYGSAKKPIPPQQSRAMQRQMV